jgi:dTDP-4-amino-4,6-dideoxygalactose transaminase
MYVNWLNRKTPDFNRVQSLLDESVRKNHYTNSGPLSKKLEEFLREKLEIDDSKIVRATASGTAALHALVEGMRIHAGKNLKFATHAWTFPSAVIGPLAGTQVVDLDGNIDIDLAGIPNDVDGIIVTHPFGYLMDVDRLQKWAKKNDKILIFDNAASPLSYKKINKYMGSNSLNLCDGSFISLHQTKSLGFGEGGLLVADEKYAEAIDRAMNFGFDIERNWHPNSSNYRMSDISAAFIYDHIERNFTHITEHSAKIEETFDKVCRHNDWEKMPNRAGDWCLLNSLVFFTQDKKIKNLDNFEWKKYYRPIADLPNAQFYYSEVICLPCHLDVTSYDLMSLMK